MNSTDYLVSKISLTNTKSSRQQALYGRRAASPQPDKNLNNPFLMNFNKTDKIQQQYSRDMEHQHQSHDNDNDNDTDNDNDNESNNKSQRKISIDEYLDQQKQSQISDATISQNDNAMHILQAELNKSGEKFTIKQQKKNNNNPIISKYKKEQFLKQEIFSQISTKEQQNSNKQILQKQKQTHVRVYQLLQKFQQECRINGLMATPLKAQLFQQILEVMSQDKGIFQEALLFMKEECETLIICFNENIYKKVREITNIPFFQKQLPYAQLLDLVLKDYDQGKERLARVLTNKDKHIDEIEEEMQDQAIKLQEFADKIQQQQKYIIQLEQQEKHRIEQAIFQTKMEKNKLAAYCSELKEKLMIIEETNSRNIIKQNSEYEQYIAEILKQKAEFQKRYEDKNKIFEELKIENDDLAEKYKTGLIKLKEANERLKEFKQKCYQLDSEKSELAVRGYVAFNDMTPRPNLNCLEELINIEKIEKEKLEIQIPTQDKIKQYAQRIKNIIDNKNLEINQQSQQLINIEDQSNKKY